ncbi:MAG: hypothetical protein FWE04_04375 [Oscillospiraceae bacterium]|nr:hypothetical protein [Oscillospiraceae bacterium]
MEHENISVIWWLVLTVVGSGGLVALIQGVFTRKKTKVDTESITVKNAMNLESIAIERYTSTLEKLAAAERIIADIRKEMENDRQYILVLQEFIYSHGFEVPERPKID